MALPGNISLLCWYAYPGSMHFLWASPEKLRHVQELMDRATFFWDDFRSKEKCLVGVR